VLVVWLKVQALSSNPNTAKQNLKKQSKNKKPGSSGSVVV
jgi:hypothetical protein